MDPPVLLLNPLYHSTMTGTDNVRYILLLIKTLENKENTYSI